MLLQEPLDLLCYNIKGNIDSYNIMEQFTIRKTKEAKHAEKIAFFTTFNHFIQSHPEFNMEEYDNPCLPYKRLRLILLLPEWKPFFRYTYAKGRCNALSVRFHRMYTSLSNFL